jgi:hypothetical protein
VHYVLDGNVFKCVPVRKLIESKVPILFLLLRKRKCVCERVRERNR